MHLQLIFFYKYEMKINKNKMQRNWSRRPPRREDPPHSEKITFTQLTSLTRTCTADFILHHSGILILMNGNDNPPCDMKKMSSFAIKKNGAYYIPESLARGAITADIVQIKDGKIQHLGTLVGNFYYFADENYIYKITEPWLYLVEISHQLKIVHILKCMPSSENELRGKKIKVLYIDCKYAYVSTDAPSYHRIEHGVPADRVIAFNQFGVIFGIKAAICVWRPFVGCFTQEIARLLTRGSSCVESGDMPPVTSMRHGDLISLTVDGYVGIIVINILSMTMVVKIMPKMPDDHIVFSFGLLCANREPLTYTLHNETGSSPVVGDIWEIDKISESMISLGEDRVAVLGEKKIIEYKVTN